MASTVRWVEGRPLLPVLLAPLQSSAVSVYCRSPASVSQTMLRAPWPRVAWQARGHQVPGISGRGVSFA